MRSRKILCGFITALLLVVSFSAAFPMADEEGVALQGEAPPVGADDGQTFFVMFHVKDAPSDLSEDTFIANVPENEIDSPESL
ncbi:MAG: hypothetical protein J6T40_09150 [Clostridiales bacterium]|nr:hypothetical protein [Clostridiales bacterium]